MVQRMLAAMNPTAMMAEAGGLLFVWTGGMYTDIYVMEDETPRITDLCMAMKNMDGEREIKFGDFPGFIERVTAYLEVL